MKFTKNSGVQGIWINKKELKNGTELKLVSEAKEEPSQQGGTQIVAKCRTEGDNEPKNVAINNPSKNALIDAFGEDSKEWVNKPLTIQTEKVIVGGKRGIALYLIPDGFEVVEDSEGYVKVLRIGTEDLKIQSEDIPL